MSAINKTIHEAMGLCWHKPSENLIEYKSKSGDFLDYPCNKCREPSQAWKLNPDYTSPVHYCALMDWMRDRIRSCDFEHWISSKKGIDYVAGWLQLTRKEQITLIAEAIEAGVLK